MIVVELFEVYTLPRLEAVFINSAWTRSLDDGVIYRRNPYTDIDVLIARLLNKQELYEWKDKNTIFDYAGTQLKMIIAACSLMFKNCGARSCIITPQCFFFSEEYGLNLSSIISKNLIMEPGMTSETIAIPSHFDFLLIKEGNKQLFFAL